MSMKTDLPRQLQRQQEEVEKIEKEMAEQAAQGSDPPAPVETPKPDEQGTPPPAPPPTPPVVSDDQWKQRYLTLKGKYEAEVPRLHQTIRDLTSKVDQLIANTTPKVETPAPPEPSKKPKRVTEKDVETFGSDLIDVIKRQAEEIAADAIADLQHKVGTLVQENAQLKQQVSGVSTSQAKSTQELYFSKLAAAVPDWETVNTSQGFLDWLAVVDQLSGVSRQTYLDHAFQTLDSHRTIQLFNAYKAATTPPTPPATPPAPKPNEVQRQVAPGKSKTPPGPTVSDASTKIWTSVEIDKFYADMRAGHYRTNQAEAARIESEIDAAVASGRVKL